MNYTAEEISRLREHLYFITRTALPFRVEAARGAGLSADWDGGDTAFVTAEDATALSRALFLLTRAVTEGKTELHAREERRFAHCGAMLDMSRNGVMTVGAVKRWIDRQAALGLNLLMLYTEDTYEVPEYPYFGYLRGRYTQAELREIDDYAFGLGVELVPCIQTLGHLKQFLQWPSSAPLRDQPDILLADSEETYAFLDAALRSIASCFRSRRIHIGMDEAHGVGLGAYLRRYGFTDRFALLARHLDRVTGLCEKYGFRPMMWSDMFFRLGSKTNEYYDMDVHVPDGVIAGLPQVEQVYWDYYHTDEETYTRMLREHKRMGRGTVFAGGVWAWSGFLPNRERSLRTMVPALRVCARERTDTVLATLWGDDGAETDYEMAFDRMTLFSEACWEGENFSLEECDLAADCLTRVRRDLREALDAFYADSFSQCTGKMLLWCDPFYPCGVSDEAMETLDAAAEKAMEVIGTENGMNTPVEIRYAYNVFNALRHKIRLIRTVRRDYRAGDREDMENVAEYAIPLAKAAYERLMETHRELWERARKRQGWEVLALRYGGALGRLDDAGYEIRRWCANRFSVIAELEDEALPDGKGYFYDRVSTPSAKT